MKTVILSSNDDRNYLDYLPYVQSAWNKLGWKTFTFYLGNKNLRSTEENGIINITPVNGARDETVVQVSRLLAHHFVDGLIMTSDVDMMPLSDYWHPKEDRFTCYGSDLTNNFHFPICYIAAPSYLWKQLIPEGSVIDLLMKYPHYKSSDFNKWWYIDQDIVSHRLKNFEVESIPRGLHNGLAQGRIDRCEWNITKNATGKKIDAHMPRPFSGFEANDLLNSI